MTIRELALFEVFESISLFAVTLWLSIRIFNSICSRVIGEKIIDKYISIGKKRLKAYQTRFKGIKADLEFTAYLNSGTTLPEIHTSFEEFFENIDSLSEGDAELIRSNWENQTQGYAKMTYKDIGEFELSINLIRDTTSMGEEEPEVSSIGVKITFDFPFQDLKGVLLDMGDFVRFLENVFESRFDVDRSTQYQITVSSLDNNLTLDDWIEEQQFEVSLLLTSEDNRRSVEFFEDRAIITSPHSGLDNKTAEYVRLTLLNYYL